MLENNLAEDSTRRPESASLVDMTTTTSTARRYYDHSKNQANAAVGHAMAAASRDVKATNQQWEVEFIRNDGSIDWWQGCYYDALGLAKQLVNNGFEVRLKDPKDRCLDADAIKAARY